MDAEVLEELRGIFIEEVVAQREALGALLVTLESDETPDDERQSAVAEAFRIAHALKGAARAVDDGDVVQLAHTVEDALADVRTGGDIPLAQAIKQVRRLLDGLPGASHGSTESLHEPDPLAAEFNATIAVSGEDVRELLLTAVQLHSRVSFEATLLADATREVGERFNAVRSAITEGAAAQTVLREITALEEQLRRAFSEGGSVSERAQTEAQARDLALGLEQLYSRPVSDLLGPVERNALEVARLRGKKVRFEAEGGILRFDRAVLHRVFEGLMHLVTNAVDHGIERPDQRRRLGKAPFGRVRLRVRRRGAYTTFSVSDDGRGLRELAAEDVGGLPAAFEPGLTTAAEESTVSGRGMGLEYVRRCAEELGGKVEVLSREGQGTKFTISIPTAEGIASGVEGSATGEVRAARSHYVLVADDSTTTRELVRRLLEDAGYDVDTAPDGQVAWLLMKKGGYDAIVSDLEMPGMDGFELLQRVRREDTETPFPFITLTARDEEDARARCRALGVTSFVTKDVLGSGILVQTLAEALAAQPKASS